MRSASVLNLAALMLLSCAAAHAEPTVKETITTYPVRGKTPRDIRADINHERVKLEAVGTTFDAFTRWNVRWNFHTSMSETGCVITGVETTVEVKITMPEIAEGAVAGAQVVGAFRKYYENLLVHERGHAQIGIDGARAVEAELPALPPKPTCPEAAEAASAHARSLIENARDRNKAYDNETRHGQTQGARFP